MRALGFMNMAGMRTRPAMARFSSLTFQTNAYTVSIKAERLAQSRLKQISDMRITL
jgi:hypothetical protein